MSPIIFNGKSYSSVDEMPPDVRQAYEQVAGMFADKNHDGIPDILEGAAEKSGIDVQSVSISSNQGQVFIDGKAYSSIEEMPAEVRQKYEQAMMKAGQILRDANQNNIPDILEGILPAQRISSPPQAMPKPAAETRRSILESTPPVVTDATPKFWLWLLIGGVIAVLMLVIGGLIVLTFFR